MESLVAHDHMRRWLFRCHRDANSHNDADFHNTAHQALCTPACGPSVCQENARL